MPVGAENRSVVASDGLDVVRAQGDGAVRSCGRSRGFRPGVEAHVVLVLEAERGVEGRAGRRGVQQHRRRAAITDPREHVLHERAADAPPLSVRADGHHPHVGEATVVEGSDAAENRVPVHRDTPAARIERQEPPQGLGAALATAVRGLEHDIGGLDIRRSESAHGAIQ